jgi:hypothetical protein
MNIRDDIYGILKKLPYAVYHTRLDPFLSKLFPVISVQYEQVKHTQISHDYFFRVDSDITITLANTSTSEHFDLVIDGLVDEIISALMREPGFFSRFEQIPEIAVKYGFVKAGDTDLASAMISMSFQHTRQFAPQFENNFLRAYLNTTNGGTIGANNNLSVVNFEP